MTYKHNISVTILTKNSEKYLAEVLESVRGFDEVLLYDNGSADSTFAIAKRYPNVRVERGAFTGFGPTHNHASELAKHDWILSIDSDEVVTPELAKALLEMDPDPKSVYSFPRHNYFNGKFIQWCGWYPDRVVRLYNRKYTRFTDAQVHESVNTDGMLQVSLEAPLIHYSYANLSDFLSKMQSYSNLFAAQNCGKKRSSPCKAVLHGFFAFFKSYVLKRGFLGGYEGYVISVYNGHTAFYKYLKLYEANHDMQKRKRQDMLDGR